MKIRSGLLLALVLGSSVSAYGQSNPFVGKWELADKQLSNCMKNLEVTEKSIRTPSGIKLYTLVKDGNAYIFDIKDEAGKILATVQPDKTIRLQYGVETCAMRRAA